MKIFGYELYKPSENEITIRNRKKAFGFFRTSQYPYSPNENSPNENIYPFDGEKTPYELGNAYDSYPDYYTLRIRGWDAFLRTDVVQNAIKKYCLWVVGSGLKLQSEPIEGVLSKYADSEQLKNFSDSVEQQFRLYCELKESSYSGEQNIHEEAAEALKNALIAGDILCLNRYYKGRCTIETIDGRHVQTPISTRYMSEAEARGNRITCGVELNKRNQHVAYYVLQDNGEYNRIESYGRKSGRRMAWLMYGNKHRKSDVRGMSLLTQVLSTTSKMDRYKDAALGSAEENAKIPYTLTHNYPYSTGENALTQQMMAAFGKGKGFDPDTIMSDADAIAIKVARTTNKTAYNLPIGSKLERENYEGSKQFKDFFGINLDVVYSTLSIPPEVAQDKFGGSYSGSRAALKSWEHKMKVDRKMILQWNFYQPFFNFWLDISVLKNEIQAPGYIIAMDENNYMIVGAYRNARFIGPLVPHIDPMKEVKAIREMLGEKFKGIPLTTIEQILEMLSTGDLNIVNKLINEKELFSDFLLPDTNQQGTIQGS